MQNPSELASAPAGCPTPADLEEIAHFTRRTFRPEELYVFSVVLCDNEIDRDFDRFSLNALEALCRLYVGKTGIFDHSMRGKDQTARIFSCRVEELPNRLTRAGEPYTRLVARAYLPRTETNKALILELDSGIKKEVSVGCAVGKALCSVCGADVKKEGCPHRKGQVYPGQDCLAHTVLEDPTDAYEWSFVAVPAQPAAGVIKSFSQTAQEKRLQGGEEMEGTDRIQKMVEAASGGLTLTQEQTGELQALLKDLNTRAADGAAYREELCREMLRLCALAQPGLPVETLRGLSPRMTLEEIKAFRGAFEKQAAAALPLKPQLAPAPRNLPQTGNNPFKI